MDSPRPSLLGGVVLDGKLLHAQEREAASRGLHDKVAACRLLPALHDHLHVHIKGGGENDT